MQEIIQVKLIVSLENKIKGLGSPGWQLHNKFQAMEFNNRMTKMLHVNASKIGQSNPSLISSPSKNQNGDKKVLCSFNQINKNKKNEEVKKEEGKEQKKEEVKKDLWNKLEKVQTIGYIDLEDDFILEMDEGVTKNTPALFNHRPMYLKDINSQRNLNS